ncbi:hypothetical protein ACFX1S_034787 [Malus domestica]
MEEMKDGGQSDLEYDFYRETCPAIETIVRSTMVQLYSHQKNISAQLLRLFFRDCFIQCGTWVKCGVSMPFLSSDCRALLFTVVEKEVYQQRD